MAADPPDLLRSGHKGKHLRLAEKEFLIETDFHEAV
jgi:hypothetical protein